jgi:hypothetical protein
MRRISRASQSSAGSGGPTMYQVAPAAARSSGRADESKGTAMSAAGPSMARTSRNCSVGEPTRGARPQREHPCRVIKGSTPRRRSMAGTDPLITGKGRG